MEPSQPPSSQPARNQEPWLAVNLSKLLPGLGQVYARQPWKGALLFLTWIGCSGLGIGFFIGSGNDASIGVILLAIATLVIPLVSWIDAYYSVKRQNSREFEAERQQTKDPWFAVFLSSFIPGLGHWYLRQWFPAGLFLFGILASAIISNSNQLILVLLSPFLQFGLIIFMLYHVYMATPGRREQTHRAIILFIAGFAGISIVLSAILALLIRQFVAEARYIPAGSMQPTLQINDRLVINKLAYQFNPPARGDIIVFSPTEQLKQQQLNDAFVKRIIGLPGDTVEIKNGQVLINNRSLKEPYILESPNYQWGPATVPPNAYFVLGDNRNNSYDSHYWGFVPRSNIIGKATRRFYPLDRAGSLAGQ